MQNLSLDGGPLPVTADLDLTGPNFQSSFPSLQSAPIKAQDSGVFESSLRNFYGINNTVAPPPGFGSRLTLAPEFIPRSMLTSSQPATGKTVKASKLSVEDSEAFPTLGSAVKGPKKHHGKRGHGHSHKDREPSSMADVVKMLPAASQSPPKDAKLKNTAVISKENSAAAQSIPGPEHLPWLETGERANKAYLKARQDAIKHGGARNKFLQRYTPKYPNYSYNIS